MVFKVISKDVIKVTYDFMDFTSCYNLLITFVPDSDFKKVFEKRKHLLMKSDNRNVLNNGLYAVMYIVHHKMYKIDDMICMCALRNQEDVVKFLLTKNFIKYKLDNVMILASQKRHFNIVKMLIKAGARNYDELIRQASYDGYIEIVELAIKYGANDFDNAMYKSIEMGHIDIVKLLIKTGKVNISRALQCWGVYYRDNIDIVKILLDAADDSIDCDWILCRGTTTNRVDIIKMMIDYGVNNFDHAIRHAAICGHTDIIEMLIEAKSIIKPIA